MKKPMLDKMSNKKSNEIRVIWKPIKGKYVGNNQGENDSDVKQEVPINKDGPKDVRTARAQVVTIDVHEDPTSEHVTTVDVDVAIGTIGVSRDATTKGMKIGVIKDVARSGFKEAAEYAFEDVHGGALVFLALFGDLIWLNSLVL